MFSDTLFRIVNTAGGLGLDDGLWRREVICPRPAPVRTGEIRGRIDAALARGEAASSGLGGEGGQPRLCRSPG